MKGDLVKEKLRKAETLLGSTHLSVSISAVHECFSEYQPVCLQAHVLNSKFLFQFLLSSSFKSSIYRTSSDAVFSACSFLLGYIGGVLLPMKRIPPYKVPPVSFINISTLPPVLCLSSLFSSCRPHPISSFVLHVMFLLLSPLRSSSFPICLLQVRFKTSQLFFVWCFITHTRGRLKAV